jgi:Ser/Thr protein kinase RdoA (MazF antagonist)
MRWPAVRTNWYGYVVLALSEICGLAATLSADGRSDVADAVGAAWGLDPGAARFWRSSASHVFVVREPAAYLKFAPEGWCTWQRKDAVAKLMRGFASGVAAPLPSRSGRLVEGVSTSRGLVVAMLVAAAPGRRLDGEDLTAAHARAWGAALARLHREAVDTGLPDVFADLWTPEAERALGAAVDRLRADLERLPGDARRFGVIHGDFELDNLGWDGDAPTAYDFDDAGRCWFVADIVHALRDVHEPLTAEFLTGYRAERDLSDLDLRPMRLFAAVHAAVWLLRLPAVIDVTAEPVNRPPWLGSLRDKLRAHADHQRRLVVDYACER